MDKIWHMVGEKAGDIVEDMVKNALGVGDKDKDKDKDEDDKKGGFLSIFGKDDDKDKDKGGLFSFGDDKKKDDEDEGFFSKFLDKDDDKGSDKKTGFKGLFNEQGGAAGGGGGQTPAGSQEGYSGGMKGQSMGVNDGDLLDDLMNVAEETAKGN